MNSNFISNAKISSLYVMEKIKAKASIGIILGSGMSSVKLGLKGEIDLISIPHYPRLSVSGHAGKSYFNPKSKNSPIVIAGRCHLYEKKNMMDVLHPIRMLHELGCKRVVLTNAAGGINSNYLPGDLMLIDEHINLTFMRLEHMKESDERSKRKSLYDRELLDLSQGCALQAGIKLKKGIYCGLLGPSYETAAEISMLRRIGADAVGMSTVNEAEYAASLGMKVLGISFISNLATGISQQPLNHKEVLETSKLVESTLSKLLASIVKQVVN